jgi:ABC-type nitrate/sulfonate/bicarbonate transport system substrate-binding protein
MTGKHARMDRTMRTHLGVALFAALMLATRVLAAQAQTKINLPALTFPTIINTADDIIKAKGFDKANGLDVNVVTYGTVGGEYAGIAKGEIDAGVLPPYQVTKMRGDGVPIAIYASMVGMGDTQIITRNPTIRKFTDLKDHTLAATVGFSAYQYLQIYAGKYGMKLGTDIKLVDATSALAQAQLQADRVDAILAWEPTTTRVLTQMPDARIILDGNEGWKAVTGDVGWDIVAFINDDWVKANPGGLDRVIKMYQDYGDFLNNKPEEADAIISSQKYFTRGIQAGTIATAVKARRLVIDVHPAWEPTVNKQIWQMIDLGVEQNYIKPAQKAAVYNVAPAK